MRTPLFIIIVGSSGVGKSTLLHSCLGREWPRGLMLKVPRKQTTRPLRDPTELAELEQVSREAFEASKSHGAYLVTYDSYGEHYALPRAEFPAISDLDAVLLQAAPGSVARHLQQALCSRYAIKICALEAPEEVVRERLTLRTDAQTASSLNKRVQGAGKRRTSISEFTIEATSSPDHVLSIFSDWLIAQWTQCRETGPHD